MEFIKQMKKREFIEMGLKTLAALMAAFLAIILMEGMIYSINLHAYKTMADTSTTLSQSTIAYCIEEDDDKYFVLYLSKDAEGKEHWSAIQTRYTKAECEAMEGTTVKEVLMRAPTAFEFTITSIHYVIMGVFVAAVAGFFVYKFVALANLYKKVEEDFRKTGAISFGNALNMADVD